MDRIAAIVSPEGEIQNLIVVDENYTPQEDCILLVPDGVDVCIGGRFDGGTWYPPVVPINVPLSITKRQLMLALLSMGLLDSVEGAISASDNRELKINWEYSTDFERSHTLISTVAVLLGKTDEEVDNLFRLAATK